MPYLMGIDISTTGAKALIIDETGDVAAEATTEISLSTPKPLWSEQDPYEWWDGVAKSIRKALEQAGIAGEEIVGVGVAGQMHGLVLLDEKGEVLRPAILWNDQRTGAECDWMMETVGRERFIEITGNVALTGFTAPKIIWVREHEPDVYAKGAHVLLPKDYVRYRLTNTYAMDKAGGAGTVLMDLKARDWSAELLDELGIPVEWLPPSFEGTAVTGHVSAEAAAQTGLAVGTPVMGGGGDQAAGAVGMGIVEPGVASVALGTSGVVFTPTDSPVIEPEGRLHAFCHAVPGRWHLMGVMLSAAGTLRWYRDTFQPGTDYDTLTAPAAEVEPLAEGLL